MCRDLRIEAQVSERQRSFFQTSLESLGLGGAAKRRTTVVARVALLPRGNESGAFSAVIRAILVLAGRWLGTNNSGARCAGSESRPRRYCAAAREQLRHCVRSCHVACPLVMSKARPRHRKPSVGVRFRLGAPVAVPNDPRIAILIRVNVMGPMPSPPQPLAQALPIGPPRS